MNNITISGRLLKSPQIKVYKKDGHKNYVAKYILISRKPYATKEDSINYIYCEARDNQAIFAQKHFTVGKNIGVQGYLDTKKVINSNGERRTRWFIVAERQEFLESKSIEKEILQIEENVEKIISNDISVNTDLPNN